MCLVYYIAIKTILQKLMTLAVSKSVLATETSVGTVRLLRRHGERARTAGIRGVRSQWSKGKVPSQGSDGPEVESFLTYRRSKDAENTHSRRAIPERFCGDDSLRIGAISSVGLCTFTFTFTARNTDCHWRWQRTWRNYRRKAVLLATVIFYISV